MAHSLFDLEKHHVENDSGLMSLEAHVALAALNGLTEDSYLWPDKATAQRAQVITQIRKNPFMPTSARAADMIGHGLSSYFAARS